MKKILGIICIIMIIGGFVACDAGLRYTEIQMVRLPDKLIYTAEDSQIDLSGGIVKLISADGTQKELPLCEFPFATEGEYGIYHNIDFAVPGTYRVIVTQYGNIQCVYNIEVQ